MPYEIMHLRSDRLNNDTNLLLLAIPAVVFFLVLSLLAWRLDQNQLASGPTQTAVLGTESVGTK